jgi:hypothetical protein
LVGQFAGFDKRDVTVNPRVQCPWNDVGGEELGLNWPIAVGYSVTNLFCAEN